MFAVITLITFLSINTVIYIVKFNENTVARGDRIFSRFSRTIQGVVLPALCGMWFIYEGVEGLYKPLSSIVLYWAVGSLLLLGLTIYINVVVSRRR